MRITSNHGRRPYAVFATAAAAAALALAAIPAAADHAGGGHASLHREFDVNIPVPAINAGFGPILNVCTDDDGDPSNGQTCTPQSVAVSMGGGLVASYRVIVDVLAKTAAPPSFRGPTDCQSPKSGKAASVSALGTGIQNAYVAVKDNTTGQIVAERNTGQMLGNRVTLDVALCSDPNA